MTTNHEYRAQTYWQAVAASYARQDALAAICWDGAPHWFNRFFSHFQTLVLEKVWREQGLATAADTKVALDLGCGVGRWTRWLAAMGMKVTALDISSDMLQVAVKYAPVSGQVHGSATTLPAGDGVFDLVLSVTVLQHLTYTEQEAVIAEITRTLRKGGVAVILEMTRPLAAAQHLYPRPLRSWRDLLEQHGLKVKYARGGAYAPLIRLGFRVLRALPQGLAHRLAGPPANPADAVKRGTGQYRLPFTSSWLGRQRGALVIAARSLILLSYPMEYLSMMLLGPRLATHVCLVAEK